MKRKAPLVLMELVIALGVFALAAALCLQAFSLADKTSRQAETLDRAVLLAQNGAEAVKHCRGDLSAAAALLDGKAAEGKLEVRQDGLTLTAVLREEGALPLGQAELVVTDGAGQTVFCLTASWQREAPHE